MQPATRNKEPVTRNKEPATRNKEQGTCNLSVMRIVLEKRGRYHDWQRGRRERINTSIRWLVALKQRMPFLNFSTAREMVL